MDIFSTQTWETIRVLLTSCIPCCWLMCVYTLLHVHIMRLILFNPMFIIFYHILSYINIIYIYIECISYMIILYIYIYVIYVDDMSVDVCSYPHDTSVPVAKWQSPSQLVQETKATYALALSSLAAWASPESQDVAVCGTIDSESLRNFKKTIGKP